MRVSQGFIFRLLPLSHFMPLSGHLAIGGLNLRICHSHRRTLAFFRLLPTDIGAASHDASSRPDVT
jgi:hypothetical protein